tara:strand:- start:5795 stop:6655 length:861 start_codon:yes stop_codon:yes gene_type:complete
VLQEYRDDGRQIDGTFISQVDKLFHEMLALWKPPTEETHDENNTRLRGQSPVLDAIALFGELFGIRENISNEVKTRLFRESDRHLYFDTFRFSAEPGKIQKSFTVVKGPSDDLPLVTFRNFVRHDAGERRSSGIVLPLSQQTVMLGQSDSGSYAKVLVIRKSLPQDLYRGLLISDEPDEEAVASRFMMKRSKFSDSRETITGKISLQDSGLTPQEVDDIRNKIPFSLEDEVHNAQGRMLTQDEVVQLVGTLMQDVDGFPKLTIRDDELFNPAADKFYTFNAALKRR